MDACRDLVQRHKTIHQNRDRPPRIRVQQACAACVKSKLKCDQGRPCHRCQNKGVLCQYPNDRSPADSNDAQSLSVAGVGDDVAARLTVHGNLDGMSATNDPFAPAVISGDGNVQEITTNDSYTLTSTFTDGDIHENTHFSDFLREILQDGAPTMDSSQVNAHATSAAGAFAPLDVLGFGQDMDFGIEGFDLSGLESWDTWFQMPEPHEAHPGNEANTSHRTPTLDDSIEKGSVAFKRSSWRWNPTNNEKGGQVPAGLVETPNPANTPPSRPPRAGNTLTDGIRDRMLAHLLGICDSANSERLISIFPSRAVLDALISDFLDDQQQRLDAYVHAPSFNVPSTRIELLVLMAAGGAVLSPVLEIQKFGYALQELSRAGLQRLFECDNSQSRTLQPMQLFALLLEIGLWSGDKRLVELSECQALPLVTMLRRSGRFRHAGEVPQLPSSNDSDEAMEAKWRAWIEVESFKRLAYHVFIHCGQASVALQVPPLISYAEVTLNLPARRSLWAARSARDWLIQCLLHGAEVPSTLNESLWDIEHISAIRNNIDVHLTLYVVLMCHWCLVWEFRELDSATRGQSARAAHRSPASLASSKRRELSSLIDHFQIVVDEWKIPLPLEVPFLAELLRMNLYVAFDDLQALAGKDGEERSRKVLPLLNLWQQSPDARRAVWHAAQTVRMGKQAVAVATRKFGTARFVRDFNAVVLYHAGVALWVYGLLARATKDNITGPDAAEMWTTTSEQSSRQTAIVHLDSLPGDTKDEIHRFIELNRGVPVLVSGFVVPRSSPGKEPAVLENQPNGEAAPLHDPESAIGVVISVMKQSKVQSSVTEQSSFGLPAIVRNLIMLLGDLGNAASAI